MVDQQKRHSSASVNAKESGSETYNTHDMRESLR
jgi:hypothetical protein